MERLETVAQTALAAGANEALIHALDVSETASVETFVQWAKGKIQSPQSPSPQLHVLINNAGGALGLETVADGKDEDWETMLQTNVLGVLRVTRAALPLLARRDGASIINIGSVAGRYAYEGGAVYGAAKAGELHITRTLRLELSGTGIRITSVDPGLAKTDFSLVRFKGDVARAEKPYEGLDPLVAEDIAEILLWIATRPAHVNIDEMVVKPVDQAAMHKIYRGK